MIPVFKWNAWSCVPSGIQLKERFDYFFFYYFFYYILASPVFPGTDTPRLRTMPYPCYDFLAAPTDVSKYFQE